MDQVGNSDDLQRILALPRRQWDAESAERLASWLTQHLVTETGAREGAKLWPDQAVALWEAHQNRGLFASIPVGGGKTIITHELPVVLQSRRPLLLIKAGLRSKTERDFAKIARLWQTSRPPLRVESYNQLSTIGSVNMLEEYQPDLLILDEAQKVRRHSAAAYKRISRYMRANPHVIVCALTGTILRKSLRDFAHIAVWCLKSRAPVPVSWETLEQWCNALDERVQEGTRLRPGHILRLATPADGDPVAQELHVARSAFKRRLADTPGVVIVHGSKCDKLIQIDIRCIDPQGQDPELERWFALLRSKWQTPDQWPLEDALTVFRVAGEMGCGFYYRWDPRPPGEWLMARYAHNVFVREMIGQSQRSRKPLDTEGAVRRAYPDAPEIATWRAVEPTFTPNSVATWLSAGMLSEAIEHLRTAPPTLCWVSQSAMGEALARATGLEYFSRKGMSATGQDIVTYPSDRSAIVSVHAITEGHNLQAWSHNLLVGTPVSTLQSAERWEQLLGRTHRVGQRGTVYATILAGCTEHLSAIDGALREAMFVQQTQGQTQKLLLAHINRPRETLRGSRWT